MNQSSLGFDPLPKKTRKEVLLDEMNGVVPVRYRGLAKNTARLTMLCALGNLWMVRRRLLEAQG